MYRIRIKRIYDPPQAADGYRILVDRLWPRGVGREEAALGEWNKDISPSHEARRAFNHDPSRMNDFREQYIFELDDNPASPGFVRRVGEKLRSGNVTLLFAAKSGTINHAVILREWLKEHLKDKSRA